MKRALLLFVVSLLLPLAGAHATCSAQHVCGDGNTVSCSGSVSCSVTNAGVSCDGVETKCPNYCSVVDACTECNYYMFCSSTAGNCFQSDDGITCQVGGTPRHCQCPDHQ